MTRSEVFSRGGFPCVKVRVESIVVELTSGQRIAAAALVWLARAWARVPVSLAQRFGASLGFLADLIPNRERWVASRNIDYCFDALDEHERRRLRRAVMTETGKLFFEMPAAWFRPLAYWESRIDTGGFEEYARGLLAQGKGLIVAAPHLGNWEISLIVVARIGPITAMYRPPRQPIVEPMLMRGREKGGALLVPATARGVKAMHSALARGEMVGILPDQAPKKAGSGAGEFAPFFGLPAYTMTLVPRLARRRGAPVVYVFAQRLAGGRFVLRWCEEGPDIRGADELAGVAALNAGVERCVRRCPEQYLWTYKRFSPIPAGVKSIYSPKRMPSRREAGGS